MLKTARTVAFCFLSIGMFSFPAMAATYYVSPSGNDGNDGLGPDRALRTLRHASELLYRSGDSLLLEGNQIHSGRLEINAPNNFTVASYGEGSAMIENDSLTQPAALFWATQGLLVSNIGIRGAGADRTEAAGLLIAPAVDRLVGARIEGVYAENNFFGFWITGAVRNLEIEGCAVAHNAVGMVLHGGEGADAVANVIIRGNHAYENDTRRPGAWGGVGCNVINVVDAEISENVFSDNGRNGVEAAGDAGLLTQGCRNLRIRHNIFRGQRGSAQGDSQGLALNATHSVVECNYFYDNNIAFQTYYDSIVNRENIFRYNIGENNTLFCVFGDENWNTHVFNNTSYQNTPRDGFGVTYHFMGLGGGNNNFWNNLTVTDGEGATVPVMSVPPAEDKFHFANNAWNIRGGEFYAILGDQGYNMADWRRMGQEMLDDQPVGYEGDPLLIGPNTGGPGYFPLRDALRLSYSIQDASPEPVKTGGLNLPQRFGVDPGSEDFFGNILPAGDEADAYSIGAHRLEGPTGGGGGSPGGSPSPIPGPGSRNKGSKLKPVNLKPAP